MELMGTNFLIASDEYFICFFSWFLSKGLGDGET
jgi:hypothetical protein